MNVESFVANKKDFETDTTLQLPHLLFLTETWTTDDAHLLLNGFSCVCKHKFAKSVSGEVAIFLKKVIPKMDKFPVLNLKNCCCERADITGIQLHYNLLDKKKRIPFKFYGNQRIHFGKPKRHVYNNRKLFT